jgi:CubicO group peptidase (beta-lactamase class C family)
MLKRLFLILCFLLSPAPHADANLIGDGSNNHARKLPIQSTERGRDLDESLRQAEARGFSGAVLVAKGGKVILSKGYGLADRSQGVRITENTVFLVGSLAKQFTAAAVLKLEMSGKLQVQDLIGKYFDSVPEDKRGITIHHLLTHSSGLPREHSNNDYDPAGRDEVVRRILQSKLRFAPGERYQYSNTDYMLLAAIIEKVSGQPFERFLRKALFKPAGMSQTGFVTERRKREGVACGYEGSYKGSPLDEPIVPGSWFRRGGGGILSTAADLYRWHLALKRNAILSAEATRKMFAPQVSQGEERLFYGYGWVVTRTDRGTNLVWHNGGWYGFYAEVRRYLDEDVVVIFLTNQPGNQAEQTLEKLSRILFAA